MSPLDSSNPMSPPRVSRPAKDRLPPSLNEDADLSSGVPPVLAAVPTFGSLLTALGRRWMLAFTLALMGGALIGGLLWYLVPARYTAELRVQLRRPPDYMPSSGDGSTVDDYVRSQAQLLRSSRVIGATLRRDEVRGLDMVGKHGDDTSWLAKDLVIKAAAGENVLPIKLTGDDSREMAIFLNALIDSYREALRDERKNQLSRLERMVGEDAKELAGYPVSDLQQIESLLAARIRVQTELRRAQSELDSAKSVVPVVDSLAVSEAVDNDMRSDPEVKSLQEVIAAKSREIPDLVRILDGGVKSPGVLRAQSEITQFRGQLQEMRADKKKKFELQLLDRARQVHESSLKQLRDRVTLLKEEENALAAEEVKAAGGLDPKRRADIARGKVVENVRNTTLSWITRIKREGAEIPWVIQLGEPNTPDVKDRKQQLMAAIGGGSATMGLLLFLVAFGEFRSRKANSSDEVTLGLGIPTVGTLPMLPEASRRAALSSTTARDLQWEGRLTEAVDAVRTLMLRSLGEGPHVVLVTSAVQGEGKTSLASQLAASLARAWRKTLLIDGDLRKPAAHQLFDLPGEPGFSEVLRGEIDPADAIKPTSVGRLWLMPAGQWDPHAQQALAQDGVANLFEQLKEGFDLVIVDSCPVLPVTDTLLLGQHADTVILSVLKGTSRLPQVYAARQRLGALDIPILGAVFVGASGALGGLDIQYPRPAR